MFKKAMMLAVAAAALVAFAIPATASANWQDHQTNLQQNASITVTGQAKFQGQVGSVECQSIANAQLTAGTTTAHTQFDVDNSGEANDEAKCSVGGGLVTVGCVDAEQVTISGAFTAHATSTQTIAVTTGTIQNHLTGGALCPKTIQLTPGTVHITTSTAGTWTTGTLSGQLQAHIVGQASQNVTVSGHGTVTPSGTYGVA